MSEVLDVTQVYKDLHQTPELGFEEVQTSKYIAKHLKAMGYEVHEGIGKTGVVAYERSNEPGPTVMLRADMDALPFTINGEKKVIHACGHDSHCSMLLAAASRLKGQIKKGTLKLFFQPGEETLKGALSSIEDGVLDDVDMAFSLHVRPKNDIPGGVMAASIKHAACAFLRIDVQGHPAHASRPHLGVNVAEMIAAIIQGIAAQKFDPSKSWSIKCTKIETQGTAVNIIPEKGYCLFDVRAETNPVMNAILERAQKVAQGVADGYGGSVEVKPLGDVIPACEYDDELTAEMADCIKEVVGADNLKMTCVGGGEDFHFYKQKKPSLRVAYMGVGCDLEPGLHHPDMQLVPEFLENGVKVLEKITLRHLG